MKSTENIRSYEDFLRILHRSTDSLLEDPTREEIFSVEGLEEYAKYLSHALTITKKPTRGYTIMPALKVCNDELLKAYLFLAEAVRSKEVVSFAAEWFVDNFHIVKDQLRQIKKDLSKNYYDELPKLSSGELAGYPRVYAIANAMITHTDSRLDAEALKRFLQSFQKTSPLQIGELWAVPITLRIALIEHLKPLALRIVSARKKREEADQFADEILENAIQNLATPEELVAMLKAKLGLPEQFDRAFIVQLTQRLRDQDPDVWPAFDWLEHQLSLHGTTTARVTQLDHFRHAAAQVTVGNIITSMRFLSALDWRDFVESISCVDEVLSKDPAKAYSKMDFSTRDQYRHAVERISKRSHASEIEVARKAVELSRANSKSDSQDLKKSHVGYHLIGDGLKNFEKYFKYRKYFREIILRAILGFPSVFYLGLIALVTAIFLIPVYLHSGFIFSLIALFPASESALCFLNYMVTSNISPKLLPKMETVKGIPSDAKTIVVIPTLFTSEKVVRELLERLEVHYLGNQDPNIYFALLSDFADADLETLPTDNVFLDIASKGIDDLNHCYSKNAQPCFFLFHRGRKWNPAEGKWIGWERKRGKILEFNQLLRGSQGTTYLKSTTKAQIDLMMQIKYVITLDSDTQLPRMTAQKLIGTITHPLNQPEYCQIKKRVVRGYGILQPRVGVSLVSSLKSHFSKIFSGCTGLDLYTTAVSDVYQDLFGEGSFTGKGLYVVDAFELAVADRGPENSVLSHDLFEGSFARSALVTDIELLDDYPSDYDSFAKRQHRWTRGDWQIIDWLFPKVPDALGRSVKNNLSLISRWKIFDNLRRTLVAPATLLWLILSWTCLPGSAFNWSVPIILLFTFPIYAPLFNGSFFRRHGVPWREQLRSIEVDTKLKLQQIIFMIVFIPSQVRNQMDAVIRALYRKTISKRKLLEWMTFAQAETGRKELVSLLETIGTGPLFSLMVAGLILLVRPEALGVSSPFLFLWLVSPFVKLWLSEPTRSLTKPLGQAQKVEYTRYARSTWHYFETFVTPEGNYLAPDNFQEDPIPVIAFRTSPTNIGMQLLSTASACDLKFINLQSFIETVEKVFVSLEKMPKMNGHFFNWYDTKTLVPLHPRYISTVDSGNLAASFVTLKQTCIQYGKGKEIDGATLARLQSIMERCDHHAYQMDFKFLYDDQTKIFAIGYNVEDSKRDNSFYDLLASESRIASFFAIAKGDVTQEHWFRLGRQMTAVSSGRALISWTATMFEYLMPTLIMRCYGDTLLDQTYRTIVSRQIQYGKHRGVPWGISEAGYNARDMQMNYQYGPFGVPGLGLKRGLADHIVISPYSTMLAVVIEPWAALKNLERLEAQGVFSQYGFYESIDYTRDRLPKNQKHVIVKSFMAHHQGMSLIALNNLLNSNIVQSRFHADPRVQATQLLLQERIPQKVVISKPRAEEVRLKNSERFTTITRPRIYSDVHQLTPRTQLLSNGNYTVMVTSAGSGYSRCGALSVSRWREDVTRDHFGHFFYIRNLDTGKYWSSCYQPIGSQADFYQVSFAEDKVEFVRQDQTITTRTEIIVSPEDNVELRRISLTNNSSEDQRFDITSFMEATLAKPQDDNAHPAFSNLFVQTEFAEREGALLGTRRRRSENEAEVWGFHVAAVEGDSIAPIQYETDRSKFIGRGHSAIDPVILKSNEPLSNTLGSVLDPIFSLRRTIRVPAGATASVTFTTGLTSSKSDALHLADKYHDPYTFVREADIAWTQAQVQLRHLNLSAEKAHGFQRLAGRLIYSDPSLRPRSHVLSQNNKPQSSLWAYGISGDLPMIVSRIRDEKDMALVRELLHAHEYLRLKGLVTDLVILNEHAPSYMQTLQEELQRQIRMSGSQALLDKPGGVFIRRTDLMPESDVILIKSVARVSLSADKGTLDEQLKRRTIVNELTEKFVATKQKKKYETLEIPLPELTFYNGLGGFSDGGRHYVIQLKGTDWTPAPWINVVANEHDFGFIISESGSGYTWSVNSRENRLTSWSNDAVSDPASEAIYIRDEETGEFWTPTPLPIRESEPYVITHAQGYSRFQHVSHGIDQELKVFVPLNATVKITRLKLKNISNEKRKLSVTNFAEWVLGVQRAISSTSVVTELDKESGAILATNSYNNEFSDRISFCDMSESNRSFTCDRKEFLGRNGSVARPAALLRQSLSGRMGAGLDPCAAFQTSFELAPGEEKEIFIQLGQGRSVDEVRTLVTKFRSKLAVDEAFNEVISYWHKTLTALEIETPDASMNTLVNGWLLYQTLSCRIWARSAFYQSGGAYGFRDQLQDVMALVYSNPKITRDQILRAAARQFPEGDVQHWWHPPTGRGVRTRFSDDLLWLPFVTSYYMRVTGDVDILKEVIPFIDAAGLEVGQDDSYTQPNLSSQKATLKEHCLRTLDRSLKVGRNGLPLMGSGDWNDGMSRIGHLGKGESVWVAWFIYLTLKEFMPFCEAGARVETYEKYLVTLKESIEKNAWDGKWYLRAFFDDGTPVGSVESEECKIDSISQSWAVLSGAGDPARVKVAMAAVDEYLILRKERLIKLFTPPFDKTELDPGYIRGYLPGVRENGGQYTHAAIWTLMAYAKLNDGDRATELYSLLNPINHARTEEEVNIYKVEPFVISADVYGMAPHVGRGGWSWYTGSSSWMYRSAIETILGFDLQGDILRMKPAIPKNWAGFKIRYRRNNGGIETQYSISVDQTPHSTSGQKIMLDGVLLSTTEIPLVHDGKNHSIQISLT